jgi:Transposase DDE domain
MLKRKPPAPSVRPQATATHQQFRPRRRPAFPCPATDELAEQLRQVVHGHSGRYDRDAAEHARYHPLSYLPYNQFAHCRRRDERKRVEMRFAHLKTHHRFERMRLRGLSGARDEFHLAAIVQNLQTLANISGGRR